MVGTAQVGETLTAHVSGIADADGIANATFSYQWLADGAEIAGATGGSYVPVVGDEDKELPVGFTLQWATPRSARETARSLNKAPASSDTAGGTRE